MTEEAQPTTETQESYQSVPYYPPRAYASGQRRVIALLIDLLVTGALFFGPYTYVAWEKTPLEVKQMEDGPKKQRLMREAVGDLLVPLIWAGVGLMAAYQILLRKTPLGTLGYILTNIKLVGPDGRSPEWRSYGKRVLICLLEIFSIGLVYIMCFKNKKHQALHDQLAGTWLIKRNAQPEGPGRIIYKTRLLGVYPVTLIDVEPEPTAGDMGSSSEGESGKDADDSDADDSDAATSDDSSSPARSA